MTEHSTNTLLDAINSAVVSAIRHSVEIATEPLLKRVATLEQQQEELYDIIKISLKGHVNAAVKHAMESPEHTIWISVLKANVLEDLDDKLDHKIDCALKSSSEAKIIRVVEEHIQNKPPVDADDISGLSRFVLDVVERNVSGAIKVELRNQSAIEADDIDGLDKFVRDVIDDVQDADDGVKDKVRDALRLAADSM
jgi:restriction endonuclease